MSFVIYNTDTTVLLRSNAAQQRSYRTEGAARAALTRSIGMIDKNRGQTDGMVRREEYSIAEENEFYANIEKKETRKGIVHSEGKLFEVGVNTPWTSGPWSETYWSS